MSKITDATGSGDHFYPIDALRCAIADEVAIEALLEGVPDPDGLRHRLQQSFTAQRWSPELSVEFWFFCDGIALTKIVFGRLDERQAELLRNEWWDRVRLAGGRGQLGWLPEILRAVVAPATVQ